MSHTKDLFAELDRLFPELAGTTVSSIGLADEPPSDFESDHSPRPNDEALCYLPPEIHEQLASGRASSFLGQKHFNDPRTGHTGTQSVSHAPHGQCYDGRWSGPGAEGTWKVQTKAVGRRPERYEPCYFRYTVTEDGYEMGVEKDADGQVTATTRQTPFGYIWATLDGRITDDDKIGFIHEGEDEYGRVTWERGDFTDVAGYTRCSWETAGNDWNVRYRHCSEHPYQEGCGSHETVKHGVVPVGMQWQEYGSLRPESSGAARVK